MRTRQRHKQRATQPMPDAGAIIFAMARHGVGFSFSPASTLRLANAAAGPSELWNLFLAGDQAELCAAVRAMLAGAADPLADAA